jgi:hypothetical protein
MPQQTTQQVVTMQPPSKGLNTVGDISAMPPTDAIECDNLLSNDQGLTLRGGWRDYAANIDSGRPVRSVFSFDAAPTNSLAPPLAFSELFACTDNGIFNVEGGGNMLGILPAITLSTNTNAGYMNAAQFTAAGGQHYVIACSETDGAFLYDGVLWKKFTSVGGPGPGVVTGVDPSTFVHVCVWKKRLMFTKRASGEVWFLDVGTVGGVAQLFDFGPVLLHGGMVLGLANWTQDAGDGIDDRLVIVGSAGDVAVYEGTNPASATAFSAVGIWYIGQPPIGRRCFTATGGNVFILTQFGLIPIAQLMQGGLDNILTSGTDFLVQLRKIQTALNNDFQTLIDTSGWQVIELPSLALIHVARPGVSVTDHIQYTFQQHSLAWNRVLDVPGFVWARRLSEVYAGTEDGRVLRVFDGPTDGEHIDGTGAYEVRGRLTPAFSYFGAPAVRKRALMIRLQFLAKSVPGYAVRMNVDFEINPITGSPVANTNAGSLWDVALWDVDLWSGGRVAFGEWRSVVGLGYSLAPSIFISSEQQTTLASIEYMTDAGGPF